jgi:preprotein translocase subunit SecG
MRAQLLPIIQIILSILLTTAVLLQQRGSGLGSAFGGDSNVFRTKRGVEKILFFVTIGLAVLFFVNAIITVLLA